MSERDKLIKALEQIAYYQIKPFDAENHYFPDLFFQTQILDVMLIAARALMEVR